MSQTIPGFFAQVVVHGLIHGQQTKNVWNFARDGSTPVDTVLEMTGLATEVRQAFRTAGYAAMSQSWALEKVTAKMLYPNPSDEGVVFAEAIDHGTTGFAHVSFTSVLMHLRTGLAGRNHRGRIFFPGVAEDAVLNSKLTDTALPLWTAFRDALVNAFGPAAGVGQWRLGVLSRKDLGGILGNYPNAFKWISNLEVSNIIAVTRSRRIGHGG